MNTLRTINAAAIYPSPARKLKSKRNNSLPELANLKDHRSLSKEKLRYNKWYIKPELRLKASINAQPEFKHTADRFTHYYESLYHTPSTFQTDCCKKSQQSVRVILAEKLCADLQNIRMLINFKSKKEGGRKRIPGVIDYFLKFKEKEEVQEKKSYLKRRKIAR